MAVPIDIQDEDHFEELLGKELPSELLLTSGDSTYLYIFSTPWTCSDRFLGRILWTMQKDG